MALNAKKVKTASTGPKQAAIEAGTYPARVVQVLDLGIQEQRAFKGEAKPPAHEIMMTYELLDEFCKDEKGEDMEDKPRWISETFPFRSLQAELAKSTKRYKALDPNDDHDGDFTALVGIPCMVTISEDEGKGPNAGKVYNNVTAVTTMRPKEAAKAKELVNPPKVFVLDEPDLEVFGSLPDWLQEKIKGNLGFEGSELQKALGGSVSNDKAKGKYTPQGEVIGPSKEELEDFIKEFAEELSDDIPW